MSKLQPIDEEVVFVLYYDGKPLHLIPDTCYGWKPTKKVYFTKRAANCGITNLPNWIDRNRITVKEYRPV